MAEAPPEMTEEDKAKELENKIRAPLIWAVDKRGIRVEDLQEKRFKEALAIIQEHFLTTEIAYVMLKFIEDGESVENFMQTVKNQMRDKMSLIAVKESTQEIVGVLTQRIFDKNSYSRTFSNVKILHGVKYLQLMRYYHAVQGSHDPHVIYETENYIEVFTMVFTPKYRGKGLEKLMLKCAIKAARCCKLTAIVGMFGMGYVQDMAKEIGFECINTVFYEKFHDEAVRSKIFFKPGPQNFGAMFMGRRIPEEEEEEKP